MGPNSSAVAGPVPNPLAPRKPPHDAKVKRVIYLTCRRPASPRPVRLQTRTRQMERQTLSRRVPQRPPLRVHLGVPIDGTPHTFAQYGKDGIWMSDAIPNFHEVADELCVIKSLNTDQFNHTRPSCCSSPVRPGRVVPRWVLGHVRPRLGKRESARICGAHFQRRPTERRPERLGQRFPAFCFPGRPMPLQRRPRPVCVRPSRHGPRYAPPPLDALRDLNEARRANLATPRPPPASRNTSSPTACRFPCRK